MFLDAIKERNIPLDFYSFHGYILSPEKVKEFSDHAVRSFIDRGLPMPELIYDEWNYVRSWSGEGYKYSRYVSKHTKKGTSLIAGAMCVGQKSDLDMMMYYDAAPGSWCGIFNSDTLEPTKPYYAFAFFRDLKKLGTHVMTSDPENIFSCGATDGKSHALVLTYYNDDDSTNGDVVRLEFEGIRSENGVRADFYLIDDDHNGEWVKSELFTAESFACLVDMKLYDTYLVNITAL